MFLTGFADEAGSDLKVQIRATKELNWKFIESRAIGDKNLSTLTDAEFIAPQLPETQVVFDCADPMKELLFRTGHRGKSVPKKDEFYQLSSDAGLVIPDRAWQDGKKGEQYRLIVDIWLKQSDDIPWTLMAIDSETGRKLSLRFGTIPGDAGMMRYIVEFKLPASGDKVHCALQFMRGDPALVRFGKVRVERIL